MKYPWNMSGDECGMTIQQYFVPAELRETLFCFLFFLKKKKSSSSDSGGAKSKEQLLEGVCYLLSRVWYKDSPPVGPRSSLKESKGAADKMTYEWVRPPKESGVGGRRRVHVKSIILTSAHHSVQCAYHGADAVVWLHQSLMSWFQSHDPPLHIPWTRIWEETDIIGTIAIVPDPDFQLEQNPANIPSPLFACAMSGGSSERYN
jgi:hypothetical protein